MSVDKAVRFGGRMACISDYLKGTMGARSDFSKESILKAVSFLSGIKRKDIQELWSQVSNNLPNIGNQDIQDTKYWNEKLVEKYYTNQMREIKAVNVLKKNFESLDADLFKTAELLGIYVWQFQRIMEYRVRIDWTMVLTIEKLGDTFTFEELKAEWENTKNEFKGSSHC